MTLDIVIDNHVVMGGPTVCGLVEGSEGLVMATVHTREGRPVAGHRDTLKNGGLAMAIVHTKEGEKGGLGMAVMTHDRMEAW